MNNASTVEFSEPVAELRSENDNRRISYFIHVDRVIKDLVRYPVAITGILVMVAALFIIFTNMIRSRSAGDAYVSPQSARLELPYDKLNLSKDGFVLPNSSEVPLTDNDLQGLNGWQVYVALNEIFARHGRMPTTACLVYHFQQHRKSNGGWYQPIDGDVDYGKLTDIEKNNFNRIKRYENTVIKKHFDCNKD